MIEDKDLFNPKQQRIYDALLLHNSVVAGSYKVAIRSFKAPAIPGEERARISIIGNAMREVMRTVPSIMGNVSEKSPKELDTNELVRTLPEKLAQFSDLDLQQDQDYIPVPRGAAAVIAELLTAASQDKKSVRENAAILLGETTATNHPATKQWADANIFFAKCTHLGNPPAEADESLSDEEIERNILVVEDLLEIRVRGFFDSSHEIKSLLNEINSPRTEDEQL